MLTGTRIRELKDFLDEKVDKYNQPSFIDGDPISIPHRFTSPPDIEISGFFAAIFAWGQRVTIINKTKVLLSHMDNAPYQFITQHQESDLERFTNFKHRTFNATDALYCIYFLGEFYKQHSSMESLFVDEKNSGNIASGISRFHNAFFDTPFAPSRTRKHIPTPERGSTCKRINMFLRWMVRKDDNNVDFGIWNRINPMDLICPIDLHVDRIARKLGLISRKQTDWLTAVELTENLRLLDPTDPVKYDFALFGMGVIEK